MNYGMGKWEGMRREDRIKHLNLGLYPDSMIFLTVKQGSRTYAKPSQLGDADDDSAVARLGGRSGEFKQLAACPRSG